MKKKLIILLLLCINVSFLYAGTITSAGTGTSGTPSVWSVGASWVGGVAPLTTDNVIIAAGDFVTTGAVTRATGTTTVINGTGTLQYTAAITLSGTATLSVNGILDCNIAGNPNIPTAAWGIGSTLKVSGALGGSSSGSGWTQNFYDVIWTPSTQTNTIQLGMTGAVSWQHDFTIVTTFTGKVRLTSTTGTSFTVNGLTTIQAGILEGTGTGSIAITHNFAGGLTLSGTGSYFPNASSATCTTSVGGDFTMSGTSTLSKGSGAVTFEFSKAGTQNFVKTGGSILNGGSGVYTFNVKSGAVLNMGTNIFNSIASNITFNVLSGGGIKIGDPAGIVLVTGAGNTTGNIQLTSGTGTSKTFNAGADYTFNGVGVQVTGTGLTGARDLTISNSSGVTLTSATSVSRTLTLTSGVFTNGANLTMANNSLISRANGSLSAAPTFGTNVDVTYTGSSSDITTGNEIPAASTVLRNLVINEATNSVILGSNINVNTNLALTAGVFVSNGNTLTLKGSSSTITGSTVFGTAYTSYVATCDNSNTPASAGGLVIEAIGTGGRAVDVLFPIGPTKTSYNPVVVNNASANVAFTARVNTTALPGITPTSVSVQRSWNVTPASGSPSSVLKMQWSTADEGGTFDRTNSKVGHYDGSIVDVLSAATAASGTNPWTVSSGATSFTGYSPFGVTSGATGTLPTVTTDATPSAIGTTTATLGGEVTVDGSPVMVSGTARGVVWSATATNSTPAIGGTGVTTVSTTGTTGTFSVSATGLPVNTQISYRAYATNDAGTAYGGASGTTFYTYANTPSTPTVAALSSTTVSVTIGGGDGNPAATSYAIQETGSTNYVQADGSLNTTAVWQTAATWGTKTVSGLTTATVYTFQVKARNGAGTPIETSFSGTASIETFAIVPSAPTVNGATTSGLDVTVVPNGNGAAIEFAIQETGSSNYLQAGGTLGGTAVWQTASTWGTKTVTGLSASTPYSFRVKARNAAAAETAFGSAASLSTLAFTPTAPTVNNATSTTLDVAINVNGNPASTQFYIHETTTNQYVQAGGTLGVSAVWQNMATWGSPKTVTGLSSGVTYTFEVNARNADNVETGIGASASGTTTSTPTVVLAGISSVAAGNILPGSVDNILTNFSIAVTDANASLTGVSFPFTNASLAATGDLTNYKLYYTATNTFGTGNLLATVTTNLSTTPISFSGLSQSITVGNTGYFWVTTNVASSPTAGHSITAGALATTDLTFSAGVSSSGSVTAQGTQTIITAPVVTTNAANGLSTTGATLNGTVNAGGLTTSSLDFDWGTTNSYGSNLVANESNFGGTAPTPITGTLTGLTANTLYYFRANATNSVGTTNGLEADFTTISYDPSISGGNNTSAQTSATNVGFTAYWTAPAAQGSAAYTYSLDYGTDNTFASFTTISGISSAATSQVITGLSATTTYYYRIKVVNAGGSSGFAASTGITTAATPVVVLANISAVSAGNIIKGSVDNVLNNFSLAVTTADATLTQVVFPFTISGLVNADITNYKLYYTATNTFSTSNLLSTVTATPATSPITFTGLSQTITAGNTGYFWITTDVAAAATSGHSLTPADLAATTRLTFTTSVTGSGTTGAQGVQTISAPTYYSEPGITMNWNSSNWGTNAGGPFNVSVVEANDYNIVIQNTSVVNMNVNYTSSTGNVVVTGTLNINSGIKLTTGAALTVSVTTGILNVTANALAAAATNGGANNGTLEITGGVFTLNGTMTVDGYFKNSDATAIVYGGSQSLAFNNFSVCELNNTAITTAPTATWTSNSNLLVSAINTTNDLLTIGTHYGNLTWNFVSQVNVAIYFTSAISGTLYIDGNFTILSTNGTSGKVKVSNGGSTNDITLHIGGDLIVPAQGGAGGGAGVGQLQLSNSATFTAFRLEIGGNVNAGTGWITNSNGNLMTCDLQGAGKTINTVYPFTKFTTVKVTGSYTLSANLTTNGSTPYTTFQIDGSLDAVGFTITGNSNVASTFLLSSNATFKTTLTTGLNGAILTYGTKTFTAGANYEFNGSSAQVVGALLTTSINNLVVNNSAGLTLSANTAVTGTLTLTSGKVTLGANTLTLTNAITGANSTNYIVTSGAGLLKRLLAGISGATLFPVGNSATSYTPLTITNTGTSQDISVASSATITNAVIFPTKVVTLQWTVASGGAGAIADITYNWNSPSNEGASFSNSSAGELGVYTGSGPYAISSLGTLSGTTITKTGIGLASGNNLMVIGNTNAVYVPIMVGWDMSPLTGGSGNYGTSPLAATNSAANVTIGGLTRGSGVTQLNTAAARGWGGNGFNFTTAALSIASNRFFTFTIKPTTGNYLNLTTINPFDYRVSTACSALIQYKINDASYVDISTVSFSSTSSSGSQIGSIDLSGISALQNIQSNSTVTFRIVPFGSSLSSTSNVYIFDFGVTTANDFAINGTNPVCPGTSATPTITGICAGATSVSGTSSEADGTVVDVYVNGSSKGTTTVSSGAWTKSGLTALVGGDIVTAYAQASGKCVSALSGSITVSTPPTTANAGSNQDICSTTTSVTLNGNAPSVGTGAWSVVAGSPSTDIGQFTDPSVRNTTFTYNGGVGVYTLRWTITNAGACAPSTADVVITVTAAATVNAGSANTICTGAAYTLAGASIGGGASNGTWSITGVTGTMTNASSQLSDITATATPSTVTFTPIAGHAGTVTLTLTTDNPTGPCNAVSTTVVLTVNGYVWSGATDGVWGTTSNWSSCGVPTSGADVTIATSGTNPTLPGDITLGRLTINAGSILNIGTNTLTINGAVSGAGTITGSPTSNLTIGGTATTVQFTSSGTDNYLKNLNLGASGTMTIGSNGLNITAGATPGIVTVTAGGLLTTGGNLTLKSDTLGTAMVAAGDAGGNYISGNVIIERATKDKRAWRLLSAPINSSQTIRQAWMEDSVNNNGYGTHITTFSGDPNAANFDAVKPSSSIRTFANPGSTWSTTPNTTSAIIAQQGYMLFVRGNRTVDLNDITAHTAATLRITGTLKQGTQSAVSVPYSATDYTLVGNPFASPIDYEYLLNNTANLSPSFYIWDGNLAGSFGVGGYRLVSRTAGPGTDYEQTPVVAGGAVVNNTMRYINSGQAFLANATSGTANLVINEASKATSGSNIFPFTPTTIDEEMTINLSSVEPDLSINLADGIRAKYNSGYDAAVTAEDNRKLSNFNENLGITREGVKLIVERRPVIGTTDTTYLSIGNMRQKNYQLDINTTNLNHTLLLGKIVDNFTATSSPLNLNGNTILNFIVTSDPASSAADRFKVVFYTGGPLPVTFTSIKAVQQNNDIAVEWKVENQTNIKQYEVEKSTDGRSFTNVGTQMATGANGTAATYNWLDVHAVSGDNFYRVKSVGFGGDVQYTRIVKVRMGKGVPAITVYPNPVTDRVVTVQFTDMAKGNYTINLVNNLGQTVQSKLISHNGANAAQSFAIDRAVAKGNYQLQIIKPGGEKEVMKLVIVE